MIDLVAFERYNLDNLPSTVMVAGGQNKRVMFGFNAINLNADDKETALLNTILQRAGLGTLIGGDMVARNRKPMPSFTSEFITKIDINIL